MKALELVADIKICHSSYFLWSQQLQGLHWSSSYKKGNALHAIWENGSGYTFGSAESEGMRYLREEKRTLN